MLLAQTFFPVAALLKAGFAPRIEVVDLRTDLAEVERLKRILEHEHLGFSAVALAPQVFAADERTGCGGAVAVVDAVKTHHTDDLVGLEENDGEDYVVRLAIQKLFKPFLLILKSHGKSDLEELVDVGIVDPDYDLGQVFLGNGPEVDPFAGAECDAPRCFETLSHTLLLSRAKELLIMLNKNRLLFSREVFNV